MRKVLLQAFILKTWGEKKNLGGGTSLVAQWLRLHTPNGRGPGLIPLQGTRFHMPQLKKSCRLQKDGTS